MHGFAGRIVAGPPRPRMKVGRNERCPCGSGREFKTCCGAS
ncbi:MAG: SEC-C domain-containing protein [Deltaproteobacteria bacterium]|nr:SEC-C domain-containing protein [Deltaproteobacteria bacterium]